MIDQYMFITCAAHDCAYIHVVPERKWQQNQLHYFKQRSILHTQKIKISVKQTANEGCKLTRQIHLFIRFSVIP